MSTKKATPSNSKYNKKKYIKNTTGEKAIEVARKKYAKHRDKPTLAAANVLLSLPEALREVDPNNISQVLPHMYRKFMMVRNLLRSFNSKNNSASSPAAYTKNSITNVFTGALCILIKEHSFDTVMFRLFTVLGNNNYYKLSTEYQEIVFESIIEVIKKENEYGKTNIPVSVIPEIVYSSSIPPILFNSYQEVPDYYVQQYYTKELDPYPGYIHYMDDNDISCYIRRLSIDYPFESAEQEIYTLSEFALAYELNKYIKNNNLTVEILSALLIFYCTKIQDDLFEKTNGKNSKNNLLSMLSQFAGIAGVMVDLTEGNHLPESVLNIASVAATIQQHKLNIGKIKRLKSITNSAFLPLQLLNRGSILSLLSSTLGVSNIVYTAAKIENLISSIKNELINDKV